MTIDQTMNEQAASAPFLTMHYCLSCLSDDQVNAGEHIIYNTFDDTPISLELGKGFLHPDIEFALLDAQEDDVVEKDFGTLFGMYNPDLQQAFHRDTLEKYGVDEHFNPGEAVRFKFDKELAALFIRYDNDQAIFDFNHPLAGKRIHFKAHIIARM